MAWLWITRRFTFGPQGADMQNVFGRCGSGSSESIGSIGGSASGSWSKNDGGSSSGSSTTFLHRSKSRFSQ